MLPEPLPARLVLAVSRAELVWDELSPAEDVWWQFGVARVGLLEVLARREGQLRALFTWAVLHF